MSTNDGSKPVFTDEESERLAELFAILLEIDMKRDPEYYKKLREKADISGR